MKKLSCNYRMVRPAAFLFAILALCLCSVLISVYYVHSVALVTPLEMLREQNGISLAGRAIGDDTEGEPEDLAVAYHALTQNTQEGMVGPQILNDIDIAFHIEKQKEQLVQNGKSDPKKKDKEKMWPIRAKVYKPRKAIIPLSMQMYHNPHRTRENWNGERYIIYLCLNNMTCAGWGDRQHGIFSAFLLSLVTNRTLKVDMQNPCPLYKLYHHRLINWKINETELQGLSSTHLYALNDRQFRESMKVIDFNEVYQQDVVYLTTNYDYFYNLKANPIYKTIFHQKVKGRPRPILFAYLWQNVFKMNKRVIRKFTPALKKAWPTEDHKLVCAHVRFGRNPTIPTDSDIRNTMSSIKPLWKYLQKYSNPQKYRLFVASDWQGFQDKVNSMYKNITVNIEGDIIHVDRFKDHMKKASIAHKNVDSCSGFEKVIADQYVLSRCDILLLTYSVFGKAAAYLRRSNHDLYLMENGTIKSLMLFNEKYSGRG